MSDDPRNDFIGKVAQGKSFADVGGLWGTINEKVSVAHRHGASGLAMIDVQPTGNELWRLFLDRIQELGVGEVRCISGNIVEVAAAPDPPVFDIVHCSGILYHMADPIGFLLALRQIAREYVILSSAVTLTTVASPAGVLEIPQAAALLVPALQGRELEIVAGYWRAFVGEGAVGLTSPVKSWNPDDTMPWWWLPTVEALRGMCMTAGLDFVEGGPYWNNNAYALLLKVKTRT